ncbi:MAG TPA: FAD-binding protein [Steroidobacteraceae bacterium]|jgi:cholesterol oxidase|nr:FAD-binding protein [Steroidobacteraceae bacterium]
MASFDCDVVVIGSGFGGSVAALRAAEKGYRVGVMEAGRRWKDQDIPKTNWDLKHYPWFPQQSCTGFKGSNTWPRPHTIFVGTRSTSVMPL